MRNSREGRFNNTHVFSWNTRAASVLLTLLMLTSVGHADQANWQTVAAELQRNGDLIGAEKALQNGLREAAAAGPRSLQLAGALASLGVFYQDIGRFSQAETSLTN